MHIPTIEERNRIALHKEENPTAPLTEAEEFVWNVHSIHEVDARLELLSFNNKLLQVEVVC
jgi:hypothetical protein